MVEGRVSGARDRSRKLAGMSNDAAPRGKSVSATVENLIVVHGAIHAAKLALIEKHKAKRARSRKRFDFWAAVHSQIGGNGAQEPI